MAAVFALAGARASAQEPPPLTPVTRAEAVAAAATRGVRGQRALTDTAAVAGFLRSASAFPNPALAAGYTKATPQYHLSLDQPIEYPWARSARIAAAEELRRAVTFQSAFERAAAEVEADTTYTSVLAAAARARLSHRTARDADSLLTLAILRRDAGDASELEVELARVSAGQAANASASDSLTALALLLELQRLMGLDTDRPMLAPADSLTPPAADPGAAPGDSGAPLAVGAAEAAERSAAYALSEQTRSVFSTPSVQFGFDTHDPFGTEPGILPTVGITLPLPLWNQRGGEVAIARAGLARAQAELAAARRESTGRIAAARRELRAAMTRVDRDRGLLGSAERVAAMSLRAYAEGAAALPTVLEAQRAARDAVARYLDDVAAALNAAALLRLHTLTTTSR